MRVLRRNEMGELGVAIHHDYKNYFLLTHGQTINEVHGISSHTLSVRTEDLAALVEQLIFHCFVDTHNTL